MRRWSEVGGLASSIPQTASAEQPEAAQERHERPKRFVYGQGEIKQKD